jgi:DNA-binding transcriptional LysR family regulator
MRAHDLDGLVAFCLVAEKRSFTAAAAELGVTRSAMSQAIKALEAGLGVAVFARTTRDVGLTEPGERLYAEVRPAIEAISLARQAASASGGRPSGVLRLNVPRVAITSVIAPLLPGFARAHPKITVEVFTEDRFANIVEGGFDAGVRLGELVEKDMVSVRLTEADRLCVVGAPAYFAARGTPSHPRELGRHACVNFRQSSRGGLYRWEFEEAGEEFDVAVDGPLIVNDTDLKLRAAIDGLGLAYELRSVAKPWLEAGALVECLATFAPATPGFYLYFPARAQVLPKLRAFIDFARR